MNTLEIVRLLDAAIALAISAGINVARFNEMRERAGGNLTDMQLRALAEEARDAVGRL